MSDDAERVRDLLDDAAAAVDSVPEDPDEGDADALREVADEAAEILESTDSGDLLAAVGLGDEAGSIPEAIARGDADAVGDLRALLVLSDLSDRFDADGGDALAADVDEVRDLVSDRSADERTPDRDETTDEGDSTDEVDSADESDGASGTTDESDGERDREDDLEEQFRSAVDDALGGFGDDVRGAKERLEALAGGGDEDAESEGDEPEGGEDERDGGDWIGGESDDSGTGRHSTVAPPPSNRADMGRTGRLSTIPDKENRRDL